MSHAAAQASAEKGWLTDADEWWWHGISIEAGRCVDGIASFTPPNLGRAVPRTTVRGPRKESGLASGLAVWPARLVHMHFTCRRTYKWPWLLLKPACRANGGASLPAPVSTSHPRLPKLRRSSASLVLNCSYYGALQPAFVSTTRSPVSPLFELYCSSAASCSDCSDRGALQTLASLCPDTSVSTPGVYGAFQPASVSTSRAERWHAPVASQEHEPCMFVEQVFLRVHPSY